MRWGHRAGRLMLTVPATQQLTKDPYVLDFIALTSDTAERELEQAPA